MAEERKAKKAKKAESKEVKLFAKATSADYDVILMPLITEKSMAGIQNDNKITIKVAKDANKIQIKEAFQRIFQVKVTSVNTSNKDPKKKTRGGRYPGTVPGFKKAVITIASGQAIDLFKE